MSLHPLNPEMLTVEVLVVAGAGGGGFFLRQHGHPWLGIAAWTLAGLVVLAIVSTAIAERRRPPDG